MSIEENEQHQYKEISNKDLIIEKKIGGGSFGIVYKVR
jgi:hypothetical protein